MSDLSTVRADIETQLQPFIPETWKFASAVKEPTESVVPVVYLEFHTISSDINGRPLGRDQVAAHVEVTVAAIGKDQEDEVDRHILDLAAALQGFDNLHWDKAVKDRIKTGSLVWKVSLIKITTVATAPAPEPEDPEE